MAALEMYKAFVPICAVILAIFLSAQGAPAQDSPHIAALDITHDKPFVMVTINGKGPFRFVVDTGTSGEAFITQQLADQLELPTAGQVRLSDPSGQGSQKVPMVVLQSLQVAGVEFTGVKAAVHGLNSGDGDCQGLLGFRLFRNLLLTLDYPNHRMELGSGELIPDGAKSVLPFRMPVGIPVVSITIGDTQVDAQIDSGGEGLSLPLELTYKLKFISAPQDLSNSRTLSTRFVLRGATLDSSVHLGSYTFKHPFVEINPAFPMANFGACPLQSFALTFDQKNGLVQFNSDRHSLRLAPTPQPIRLVNAPVGLPPDPSLVPVG
jgi:predicted aspartyl protease